MMSCLNDVAPTNPLCVRYSILSPEREGLLHATMDKYTTEISSRRSLFGKLMSEECRESLSAEKEKIQVKNRGEERIGNISREK